MRSLLIVLFLVFTAARAWDFLDSSARNFDEAPESKNATEGCVWMKNCFPPKHQCYNNICKLWPRHFQEPPPPRHFQEKIPGNPVVAPLRTDEGPVIMDRCGFAGCQHPYVCRDNFCVLPLRSSKNFFGSCPIRCPDGQACVNGVCQGF